MLAGTQKPMLGMKLNRVHPLAKGLRGCWLFNEGVGNIAYDLSGYGNHGTLTNMAFPPTTASGWNPGRKGQAIAFDGSNDYINCRNDSSLDITDAITSEAWVKISSHTAYAGIVEKSAGGGLTAGFYLRQGPTSGDVQFGISEATPTYPRVMATGVSMNEWHHFVGVYNRQNVLLYVDAILTTGDAYTGAMTTSAHDLLFGYDTYDLNRRFNGSIGGVKIYNRTLSAAEIKWIYREPYAMFERGELLL